VGISRVDQHCFLPISPFPTVNFFYLAILRMIYIIIVIFIRLTSDEETTRNDSKLLAEMLLISRTQTFVPKIFFSVIILPVTTSD
jgi:hypothetical protein